MPRIVSATEAKNRFGSIVGWVLDHQDEVVVESHGEPKVVVMSFSAYEKIKEMREQARRREALSRLERLAEKVRARNEDVTTEQEALEIADQFTHEAIASLVNRGKVKFRP